MKKIKWFSFVAVLFSTVLIFRVFAEDLTVKNTGWKSVGENEVQINSLNIKDAEATFDGDFEKRVTATYSDSDYTSGGKFDQERETEISYNDVSDGSNAIVYKNPLSAGTHNNIGSMTLKWVRGAKLQDGSLCDVTMNVDNITIKNNRNSTKPISLFVNLKNENDEDVLWMAARYAKEEVSASSLSNAHKADLKDIGIKYDVTFKITKTGTDEVVDKNIVLNFSDLDMADHTLGSAGNVVSNYVDGSGDAAEYAEGITLVSGVVDNVYTEADSVSGGFLKISNTSYGNNTRFTGLQSTSGDASEKAGFSTKVRSTEFKYTWTGSDCGTAVGFVPVKRVVTSTSGEYPNNVHITATDREVLWKEDKEIEITPDDGYSLSKVTVDGRTIDISTLTRTNGKYYYTFDDVISNHTIDVQVTRQPYTLLVHHYKEGTTEKLGDDVEETKYYGDSYTTSPLSNIPEGYELSSFTRNTSGTIMDNTVVIYYYKLKEFTLTVHHYEEGTTNSLAPDEVSTKKYGDEYSTSASSSVPSIYEYVNRTENHEGTISKNEVVNYYYKKKKGNVIVHHYIENTTTKLANDETYTKNYGDVYETSASSSIPKNYVLKTTPTNYRGEVNKPTTEVIYYYQKKDSKIVPEISKSGTQKISSSNDKVSYKIIYKDTFTDLIGNGTVTIVDTLPYKIDVNNSNLDGGTYNESNKTITWTENISINSYDEASKTFEKNIEVKYIGINASEDVLVNKVKGTITADNKTIDVEESFNTIIDINGDITERYLDKDTGEPIIPNVKTTNKVGTSFTPDEKKFEGYVLVTKPDDKDYKYEETPQTLTYEYEKIKLKVVTKVNGTGGVIEGDEVVLYGDDSTKDKIKMQADNGYIISKVLINGEELGIPENIDSLILSNFMNMTEDKLIEVSFEPKPAIVEAPKTDSNKPLFVIIIGILFVSVALVFYLYKTGKLSSLLKKNK